jgi:Helicase HerA, central domain
MSKKDAIIVGLALMACLVLGSFLLLLDPDMHARFLEAIDTVGTGAEILFGLGCAAIGVKIWKMASTHVIRDGKDGQTARVVVYRGQVVQIGSAELGLNELLKLQSDLVSQQKAHMQVIDAESKAMRTMLPLLEAYGGDVEDRPQIEAPKPQDEYLNISDDYQPHADEFLSGRKLVVGVSGSGKSNSTATICEELGRLDVPMILADTENEYESLCDKRYLPHGVLVDASKVNRDNAAQFGAYILENNIQAILNLQSYEMEEAAWVMVSLIQGLNQWQEARANEQRVPIEFLLEEATTWLPQNVKESALNDTPVMANLQSAFFNDMVRKGRKRGLGLTVICQKIAEIDKRALQCDVKLLHRQTELNDLDRYKKMGITVEETLSLQNGQGYYFSSKMSKALIQVRRRYSNHGANTPGLKALRSHQKGRNSFPCGAESGSEFLPVNGYGNDVETASEADLRVIDGVFPSDLEASVEPRQNPVSNEKRETIKRLLDMGMPHRDVAKAVGLSGRNYHTYQQVCREEGVVPHEIREGI